MASVIAYALLIIAAISHINAATVNPGSKILENKLKFLTAQPFNDFDWKLSKALDKNVQTNFVVSPLSVKLSIGMLYLGLQGGTAAKEIEDALKINSTLKETVEQKFSTIMKALESKEESFELNIGTKLFLDKSAQINTDFERKLKDYYNSSIQAIDFKQQAAAAQQINDWSSKITKGKIQQLINEDDINDGSIMMLLNAIYFRGEWENPFLENFTKYDTFYVSSQKQVTVQMMVLRETICYYNIPELRAHLFRLPYVGKKFAMYIIYPHDVDGLPTLANNLNPEVLAKSLKLMKETLVLLRLPKFKFESTAILLPILQQLNIKEIFSEKAGLDGIASSPKGPLMISSIIQKSGIEVNEKGSVASAATNVMIDSRFGADAIDLTVNHPFVFLIADEVQDTIIFAGKVIDPSTFNFPPPKTAGSGPATVAPPASEEVPLDIVNRIKPGQSDEQNDRFNYFDKELLLRVAHNTPNENIVLSPASIKASLALVFEGANGLTEKELIDALRLPDDKASAVNILLSQFKSLKNANSVVTVDSKNKVYVADDEKLSPRYRQAVVEKYGAEIEQVNFGSQEATANNINNWVKESTKGLIPSLVEKDDLDASTKLFLANCIYFKGDWLNNFQTKPLRNDCFYTSTNNCQTATLMTGEQNVNYYDSHELDAKVVELPFKDERYTMIVILPNEVDGVYTLLKDLQHRSILELFGEMRKSEVFITLPRTTIEFSVPLSKALKQLDIKDVFNPTANLSGLLDQRKPIAVKEVVHKAKIEINEKGAKAAAATGTQVVLLSIPEQMKEFKADHPFLFFIRDTREPGFLFEGLLISPDKPLSIPSQPAPSAQQPVRTTPRTTRATAPNNRIGVPQSTSTRRSNTRPSQGYQSPRPTEKGSVEYPAGDRTYPYA